jgi:hypothetical protein
MTLTYYANPFEPPGRTKMFGGVPKCAIAHNAPTRQLRLLPQIFLSRNGSPLDCV